ncbi:ABC transporter ATP-binding protein [Mesorhizobium sp. ASY16-5R]|uniref:ABC transporter ATP-binding protein n=1 Tax=Mesorhizobium sp. ASY16-5R TaxID=3445772 RepID=UPI003FA0A787
MLEVRDLGVSYGAVHAVRKVSIIASPGRITAIFGANGAGKSSVIRAIVGLVPSTGTITMNGHELTGLPPDRRASLGLACVLEGRRLFRDLSVEENLQVAWSFGRRREPFAAMRDLAYGHFPILGEKRHIPSALLSGGQQQMLIISSAMIRSPDCLLLDEPSLGLAPVIVQQAFEFIVEANRQQNTTILLTEQVAALGLRIADYGYVMRQGAIVLEGDRASLLALQHDRKLAEAYF